MQMALCLPKLRWPVRPQEAAVLEWPTVDPYICSQPHSRIGNSMHVMNAMLVVVAVLDSVELIKVPVGKVWVNM